MNNEIFQQKARKLLFDYSITYGFYGAMHISSEVLLALAVTWVLYQPTQHDGAFALVIAVVVLQLSQMFTDLLTGALADAIGRIRSLRVSIVFWLLSLFLIGFAMWISGTTKAGSVPWYPLSFLLLGLLIQGLAISFESGAFQAWYIERLKNIGKSFSYDAYIAKADIPYFLFGFFFVFWVLYSFPFVQLEDINSRAMGQKVAAIWGVFPVICAGIACFFFSFRHEEGENQIAESYQNTKHDLKKRWVYIFQTTVEFARQALYLAVNHRGFWALILLRSTFYALFFGLLFYWPLVMDRKADESTSLIWTHAVLTISAVSATFLVSWIFGKLRPDRQRYLTVTVSINALSMILAAGVLIYHGSNTGIFFIALLIYRFTSRMVGPILYGWANYLVPDDLTRATTLSVVTNIASVAATLLLGILTLIAVAHSSEESLLFLRWAWLYGALILLIVGLIVPRIKPLSIEEERKVHDFLGASRSRIEAFQATIATSSEGDTE